MPPPMNSALLRHFEPNTLPILMPNAERIKVTTPINSTAGTMSTRKKAKVTPTAKASMLVATARGSIVKNEKEAFL